MFSRETTLDRTLILVLTYQPIQAAQVCAAAFPNKTRSNMRLRLQSQALGTMMPWRSVAEMPRYGETANTKAITPLTMHAHSDAAFLLNCMVRPFDGTHPCARLEPSLLLQSGGFDSWSNLPSETTRSRSDEAT